MRDYDLIVIGGGAGGLVAAREATRRKARVAIVQSGPMGGDCTHTGCVPSKALLSAAAKGQTFGAAMSAVHAAVDHIAATEDPVALQRDGLDTIAGYARFRSPSSVDVDGTTFNAKQFIVATGAKPMVPPIAGLRELPPLTNETLFQLTELPASLVVLGGGPIGCEMAQAFARLGSRVTIIEALDRLLPREEPEASEAVSAALAADGVTVRCGSKVVAVERDNTGTVQLRFEGSPVVAEPVAADRVLAAIGRVPSGRGFGLEEIGVELDQRGAIVVDDTMATSVTGIWAVGDVTGGLQFTHAAGRMGWVAASNALSRLARAHKFRFDTRVVPWATFTSPEVGHVGLTEAQAAAEHPNAKVAFLPFTHLDRAIVTGDTNGFVKLIAVPRRGLPHIAAGRLLGATAVAPTGGELIHEAALAMQTNMFLGRFAQTTHAYPTWSMAIQQAALQFLGTGNGLTARPAVAS